MISTQVVVADLDGDGDPDVATASSGDSSIAWFENLGEGRFCEIKRVVDDDAVGARSVVAADFDGDGLNDLASASKDDNTVALYLNREGFAKRIVSDERKGAYGLAAADVGSQAQLGQQNSLVSLDSYAFPTHEKSVTLSAATTRTKVAAMKLEASAGDGDEDALSPV